jgi:hypothetical protein
VKTPPELDKIADAVLSYRPKPKTKAAKRRKRRAIARVMASERQNSLLDTKKAINLRGFFCERARLLANKCERGDLIDPRELPILTDALRSIYQLERA